jgi:hypothetical protein
MAVVNNLNRELVTCIRPAQLGVAAILHGIGLILKA